MSKPHIHAKSSARRWGGKPDDYLDIHNWFDETKSWIPDNRHRAIRHHSEGIFQAMQIFGETRVNSEGKTYHVRDIGEQHCQEDFGGFIPCAADYLSAMESEPWMNAVRGTFPPSARKLRSAKRLVAEAENLIEGFMEPNPKLRKELTSIVGEGMCEADTHQALIEKGLARVKDELGSASLQQDPVGLKAMTEQAIARGDNALAKSLIKMREYRIGHVTEDGD